jgi:hypothetical protein
MSRGTFEPRPVERRESRVIGLGTARQTVAAIMACALADEPVRAVEKGVILRSEAYRRYVAEQECFCCRVVGFSQCAHENFEKGMALKVCDSRTFPACGPHWGLIGCHQQFDLAMDGLNREERRELGASFVAEMQARAVAAGWDLSTLRRIA